MKGDDCFWQFGRFFVAILDHFDGLFRDSDTMVRAAAGDYCSFVRYLNGFSDCEGVWLFDASVSLEPNRGDIDKSIALPDIA